MEQIYLVNKQKLKYFPVTFFSVIMGFSGLAIVFYRAYHLGWIPLWPYLSALLINTALFIFMLVIYGMKMVIYPEEVKKEYEHRIKVNFFSTISISFLLVSIAFLGYMPFVSVFLWYAGVLAHVLITFHTVAYWIRADFEIHSVNPAWFIPVVGNLIIPVAGGDLVPLWLNMYFFAVGLFFWISLFVIVLYRLIFHQQLPGKFIPTMFILMAPPAVAFIAYYKMFMSFDVSAVFLLMTSVFFLGLLVFLVKDFFRVKFYLSWWAYTFPLSAAGISLMIAYQASEIVFFMYAAFVSIMFDIVIIAIISLYTIKEALEGKICVPEE